MLVKYGRTLHLVLFPATTPVHVIILSRRGPEPRNSPVVHGLSNPDHMDMGAESISDLGYLYGRLCYF